MVDKRLIPVSSFVLACQILIGCSSFETHPWTDSESALRIYRQPAVAEQERLYVEPDHLFRPMPGQAMAAEQLLSELSFLRLNREEFKYLTGEIIGDAVEGEPYLIRGVAWSDPPWYSLVFFDLTTGNLYTQQVTYNGELYIPDAHRSFAMPMIVLLDRIPTAVKAYAVWGGDHTLTHWSIPQAWIENKESLQRPE